MSSIQDYASPAPKTASFSGRLFVLRYGVYVSLAVLILVALIATPSVFNQQSLALNLRQAGQLGLVAIGQTLVLLVAGLDLSVGGVIVLTNVVIADLSDGNDSALPSALFISLALGAMIGLVNGLLVTKRNVPPFVATLGVLVLVSGATVAYTKGIPSGFVPDGLGVVNQFLGPFPVTFLLWVVALAFTAVLLYLTPWGRRLYAVGSSLEAARLSGVRVDLIRTSAFVLCSVFAALAGIVLSGYIGYVDRYLGRGFDLDSIAAAVVGGVVFTGGRGSLLGVAAGVLLVQLLSAITLVLGISFEAQLVVKGVVIIAAVALYSAAARQP
jgi:ribose/xylose/arabinose/galactoside ABC-type transport system permease subunit